MLQFAWERCEAFGLKQIGTYLLIAVALSALILWPIARMLAGPKRILLETVLFVGSMIALSAAFIALAYFAIRSESIVFLAAVGVVYVAILFAQTRHIFQASRKTAASVLGCYLVALVGAGYATEFITGRMPWTEFFLKDKEEQRRVFAEWKAGKKNVTPPAPATVNPPSTAQVTPAASPVSIPDSPSNSVAPATTAVPAPAAPPAGGLDLNALYAQLQRTRAELDPNDREAVARFNQQVAAYQQEKAIAAAQAGSKRLPTGAAKTSQVAPMAKPANR